MVSAGKRLLVVLGLLAGLLAPNAQAATGRSLGQSWHQMLYGDFRYAGNSVVQCAEDDAECAKAAARTTKRPAGDFALRWSDVDSDPATFDSSTAQVTVPPGAKIAFARLNWGGSTASGCARPPGTPSKQEVQFSVGGSAPEKFAPQAFFDDSSYYSAHADVTSRFTGVATGKPVELTAANVWTAVGKGCGGGWSVALVYAYPQRDPEYAPEKRAIYVYDGHLHQGPGDPVATTTISGFRAAVADAHVGVTAYGGDWGTTGDQLLLNDAAVAEPGTGARENFFIANSEGAKKPSSSNNFGVDAKSFNTGAVAVGATSARLSFRSTGDDFVGAGLAFSVPVPDLHLATHASASRVHPGDQVTFTVGVANPTDLDARDVVVGDEQFPVCAKKIGNIAAGAATSYQCTVTAPDKDFTDTATVTGTSTFGDPIEASTTSRVDVLHPAITLSQQVDKPAYRAGDPVTVTLTAANPGDVPLHEVTATMADPAEASPGKAADAKKPLCTSTMGTLAPGKSSIATCVLTAPVPTGGGPVEVRGTDPLGKVVTAGADVKVPVIAPGLTVTKTAAPPVAHEGDQVTWTVTVRNTGDSPLRPVTVVDQAEPACSRTFGALQPGAEQTYSCKAKPSSTTTNSVTATGTDLSGQPVTATSSAMVQVIHPALEVTVAPASAVVREGDRVPYSVTVRNTGDVSLNEVAVADDSVPGCVRKFDTLASKAAQTYQCEQLAPADDATNTVAASGKDQLGRILRVTADAHVDVIHPAIQVTAAAAPAQVREGDEVTFTVTVSNSGDAGLHDVTVADTQVPGCARVLGTLAAQGKQTFTCTTVAGRDGLGNEVSATGDDPTGRAVTGSAGASFTVQHPAVSLTATVQDGPFREHDSVRVHVVAANVGDVPLRELSVTGAKVVGQPVESCAQGHDSLGTGEKWAFDCTVTAPGDDAVEAVQIIAGTPVGPPVSGAAEVVIDVIHPALSITQSASPSTVRPGATSTFTVTVRNSGDVELRDAVVADPAVPECAKRLGTLAPKAEQTYSCTHPMSDDLTSTVTATGTDLSGRQVSAAANAQVDVIHPAVAVTQVVSSAQVREGDQVTFTITVRNSGDVPLVKVSVVDDQTPGCATTVPGLTPGQAHEYSCTTYAGHDGYSNTVKVSAADPLGGGVNAAADTVFTVVHPGLSLEKTVHGGPFRTGDPVTFTLTVTNTGDSPLSAVKVTDQGTCAKTFDTLAAGVKQAYDCTAPAPADDVVSTASATGTPPTGPQLSVTSAAKIDVIHPSITVRPTVSPAIARVGDDLTVTLVVTNTGDVPLTSVTVKDPGCDKTFDQLAAQAVQTYQCTVKAGPDDFTNTAAVTANDPTNRAVTASAGAPVDVIHPEIALMKEAQPYQVHSGDKVTFSLLVKNVGDVPLSDVSVVDDRTTSCAHQVARLAPDAEETYQCTTVAGAAGFTNIAKVSGADPTKRLVSASAQASFVVLKPSVSVVERASGGPFRAGESLPFEVIVTNTGDQELHDVTVSADHATDCARRFETLPVNGIQRYPCVTTAGSGDPSATVTATPPSGAPVTATAKADFSVLHPAVELRREHLDQPIRPGDPVTHVTTVRNTGDSPLHEVTFHDADEACSFTLRTLEPGAHTTRACTQTARADLSGRDTVTATDETGHTVVNGTTTTTDVTGPGLTVTATPPPRPVLPGHPSPVTTVAKNTGDVPLADVRVTGPGCASEPVELAPGATTAPLACEVTTPGTVTATGRNVAAQTTPRADAQGATRDAAYPADARVAGTGALVSAQTPVRPNVANPTLRLTERGEPTAAAGATVTFLVAAENTGTSALTVDGHRLLPGIRHYWTRSATAPTHGRFAVQVVPEVDGANPFIVKATAEGQVDMAVARPVDGNDLDLRDGILVSLGLLGAGALLVRITWRARKSVRTRRRNSRKG
ncbi:DUF11 domain-containing protein [Amycolatopsis panacis]|uniref:DUF11 domain-containing protein n=1 Tax=Amycolatopsis panacis TaxID=2340917 RepID=A0A419I2W5_9PSEU|nr:DUF11 domain-containing protein [Amycolatopsis panacis]